MPIIIVPLVRMFMPSLLWIGVVVLVPHLVLAQTVPVIGNQVVLGHVNACTTGPSGGTDAYACTLGYALTAYQTQACYRFVADVANTGAATLNLHSLGAKAIVKVQGGITTPLADNDIRAGQLVAVCYDGTNMQCQNCSGNVGAGVPAGSVNQAQYNNAGAFAGSSGQTLDATTVTGWSLRVTPMSGDLTLGAAHGPIVACTAGATERLATLPLAATATQHHWRLVKVDTGPGACTLTPAGSDTMNGLAAAQQALTRGGYVEVERLSATDWHATVGRTAIDLSTDVTYGTGIRESLFLPARAMDVNGACTLGAAAVLVTGGPKLQAITCTDADADGVEVHTVLPAGWDGGTVTLKLAAFSLGNNTGEVVQMRFSGQCVREGDSVQAFAITSGTAATSASNVAATLTFGNTAAREQFATTAALTLAGTCAGGAHVYLRGFVNATATTLTPMSDVKVLGVTLTYTRWAND